MRLCLVAVLSCLKGRCHYTKSCKAASCSGYKNVMKNEDYLMFSVAHAGPVVVAIDVNHRSFWYYKQGIWYEPKCSKTRPNHAMLAVGYGTARTGGDYWIIKNSWGTTWGNKGYVYTARNKNNMCGVASFATYPIV